SICTVTDAVLLFCDTSTGVIVSPAATVPAVIAPASCHAPAAVIRSVETRFDPFFCALTLQLFPPTMYPRTFVTVQANGARHDGAATALFPFVGPRKQTPTVGNGGVVVSAGVTWRYVGAPAPPVGPMRAVFCAAFDSVNPIAGVEVGAVTTVVKSGTQLFADVDVSVPDPVSPVMSAAAMGRATQGPLLPSTGDAKNLLSLFDASEGARTPMLVTGLPVTEGL